MRIMQQQGVCFVSRELGFVPRAFLHRRDKERGGGHDIGKLLPSLSSLPFFPERAPRVARSLHFSFLPSGYYRGGGAAFSFLAQNAVALNLWLLLALLVPTKSGRLSPHSALSPNFLFGSRGTLFRSVPLFFVRASFFSCTVQVKGGRAVRVSRHGILLVRRRWSRFFSLS